MKRFLIFILFFGIFVGEVKAYRVGVDYHATSANFVTTAFITQYEKPEVRAKVIEQLQGMANAGAKVINTRLWLVDPPSARVVNDNWRMGFPPSEQELINLKQYVEDVAKIKTPDGGYLDLYLTILGNGCAGYNGEFCKYTWDQTVSIYKKSYTDIVNVVGDVNRADGKKVVSVMYITGEVMIGVKKNEDKFLIDLYPFFYNLVSSKGITPSLYFIIDPGAETAVNLRTMYVTGAIDFMKKNNLPVPDRIDMSFYNENIPAGQIKQIFLNLQKLYPNKRFGVAETHYMQDPVKRRRFGQEFAESNRLTGAPEELFFWTTPDSGGAGVNAAYPFNIDDYYLPNTNPSCVNLYYKKNDGTVVTTTSKYFADTMIECAGTGKTCSQNLATFLAGQTTGICYAEKPAEATVLGDFNNDGKTDLSDFGIWKKEYLAGTKTLLDFGIWKKAYLGN